MYYELYTYSWINGFSVSFFLGYQLIPSFYWLLVLQTDLATDLYLLLGLILGGPWLAKQPATQPAAYF